MQKEVQKGQIAFEFLIIYALFIFLFIAAMWAVSQKALYSQFRAEQVFARETAARFADEIDLAARFPGYEKTYYFPATLRGMRYDVSIKNGVLLLNYTSITEVSFFQPLTTKAVYIDGSPSGRIDTAKGKMTLRNDPALERVIITQ